jgi:hypothetical protein
MEGMPGRPPPYDTINTLAALLQVYRDDSGSREGGPARFAHAADFHLVFRLNGRSPVTMWEPVPPEGYIALGTLVEGAPQMPDTCEVLCIRRDLTEATGTFDAPIWRWDPPALQVPPPCSAYISSCQMAMQGPHSSSYRKIEGPQLLLLVHWFVRHHS